MNREKIGLLVGVVTLSVSLSPFPLFTVGVGILSFLMARELAHHLKACGVAPGAFFSPLTFYLNSALGGLYCALLALVYGEREKNLELFFKTFFILIYVGFFPSFLILIKEKGTYLLITLLLAVWAGDVVAYYVGRRFGRNPFFNSISPNKTLEGFLAGVAAGTLVFLIFLEGAVYKKLLTGIIVLSAGALGDLFKSFIKRRLGIKDFSNVLGEHGGFVDRFDALIFAAPAFWMLL